MKKIVYNGLYLVIAILLVLPFVLPNSFYLDLAVRMAINFLRFNVGFCYVPRLERFLGEALARGDTETPTKSRPPGRKV